MQSSLISTGWPKFKVCGILTSLLFPLTSNLALPNCQANVAPPTFWGGVRLKLFRLNLASFCSNLLQVASPRCLAVLVLNSVTCVSSTPLLHLVYLWPRRHGDRRDHITSRTASSEKAKQGILNNTTIIPKRPILRAPPRSLGAHTKTHALIHWEKNTRYTLFIKAERCTQRWRTRVKQTGTRGSLCYTTCTLT